MLSLILSVALLVVFISLVGIAIYMWGEVIQDFDFFTLLIACFVTLIVMMPIGLAYDSYQENSALQSMEIVEAIVVDKNYRSPSTTYIKSGEVLVPIQNPERYNVKMSFGDHEQIFDNKALYDATEVGSKMDVEFVTFTKNNKEILKHKLRLIRE